MSIEGWTVLLEAIVIVCHPIKDFDLNAQFEDSKLNFVSLIRTLYILPLFPKCVSCSSVCGT